MVTALEELLERIVGEDKVSAYSFKFHTIVWRSPVLKAYVENVDGETFVTNETAFILRLKNEVRKKRITAPALVRGIEECLL